ncbi:hypothetical protein KUCAC02_024892, partial [Chaenocephalus aceratus]
MRTVKNIADLRQNLEETMSSLRGTQITHRPRFPHSIILCVLPHLPGKMVARLQT